MAPELPTQAAEASIGRMAPLKAQPVIETIDRR